MKYVITLAYNTTQMMRASLQRFDETFGVDRKDFKHVFVNQYYPKNRAENTAWLKEREAIGDTLVMDPGRNLGLSAGFNFALSGITIKPEDIIYAYDPDMFPRDHGWGIAMSNVLHHNKIAWVSCWNPHTQQETEERGYEDMVINGQNVRMVKTACLNSVSAFSGEFLLKSKGAHEPNPLYGGFEISMYQKLKEHGFNWVFLKDFVEDYCDQSLIDTEYREWKWKTTHGGEKQEDFELWLKKRQS